MAMTNLRHERSPVARIAAAGTRRRGLVLLAALLPMVLAQCFGNAASCADVLWTGSTRSTA